MAVRYIRACSSWRAHIALGAAVCAPSSARAGVSLVFGATTRSSTSMGYLFFSHSLSALQLSLAALPLRNVELLSCFVALYLFRVFNDLRSEPPTCPAEPPGPTQSTVPARTWWETIFPPPVTVSPDLSYQKASQCRFSSVGNWDEMVLLFRSRLARFVQGELEPLRKVDNIPSLPSA